MNNKLIISIIFCVSFASCDFVSTMDIVNDSNLEAIIQLDLDAEKVKFSNEFGYHFEFSDYGTNSPILIDSNELIIQYKIKPKNKINIASSFNQDPPNIEHIQNLRILKPIDKSFSTKREIRDAFEKTDTWNYELRIK